MSAISSDTNQGKVDRILSLFLENMKKSGSYLFTGPNGSGKFLKSVQFAKASNCIENSGGDFSELFCDNCKSCRRIDSGSHPDIFIIEPEDNIIKIDKIRELIDVVSLRPYEANYRFIIIKDAHFMNVEASNALLKSLEEPPENTIFVLTTDRKHLLLDTIVSRCFVIKFGRFSKEDFVEKLTDLHGFEKEDAEILSYLSDCDIEKAVLMKDEGWLDKRQWLLEEFCRLDSMENRDLMLFSESISHNKSDFQIYVRILISFLRDMEIIKNNPELIVNVDKISYIKELSLEISSERVFKRYQLVSDVEQSLKANLNLRILIENMMFGLANI